MIYLTYKQVKQLLDAVGGEEGTIVMVEAGIGHSGECVYVGYAGYPEEGGRFLGEEPTP